MLSKALKRKKIILLRSALRRGVLEFAKQLYISFADILVRRKYLVFSIDLKETEIELEEVQGSIRLQKIISLKDLPLDTQDRLKSNIENIEWGNATFFERGRELWALELEGKIAVLGWLAFAENEQDYIWPVPKNTEILHQMTVLPEFRGKGLQVLYSKILMTKRFKAGTSRFFISCHEYNQASHRSILRMGMKKIGHSKISRLTGKLTFHPND